MHKDFHVTIVIPTYNEEKSIVKVINDVKRAMESSIYNYNILVIDYCSTDKTYEIILNSCVDIIRHDKNRGSGTARKTGILNTNSEIIVMIDADCTYEPADIPKMLSYFPDFDQVNGARTSEHGKFKIVRIITKWLIRKLASILSGYKIPDLNTGLKAFKRDIMMNYISFLPTGFSCVTTMTLTFLINGDKVKYIDTPYYERVGKSKFHPVIDTFNYFKTVIRIILLKKYLLNKK